MKIKEYAIYNDDEFLDIGTAEELAIKFGTTKNTILWYAGSNRWKNKKRKFNTKKHYIVICLD